MREHVAQHAQKFPRKGYVRNEKGRARRGLALDLSVLDTPAAEVDHLYVLEPPPHRGPRYTNHREQTYFTVH